MKSYQQLQQLIFIDFIADFIIDIDYIKIQFMAFLKGFLAK